MSRRNAFSDNNEPNAIDDIFGKVDIPTNTNRIVGKPISIDQIWADRQQPRRIMPLRVTGNWDGNPHSVMKLVVQWHVASIQETGTQYSLEDIVQGDLWVEGILPTQPEDADLSEKEWLARHPITASLLSVVSLAKVMHRDKQLNPISVMKIDKGQYIIESGERRWTAFHILRYFYGEAYTKIAAQEVEFSVWRQASENNSRDDLNAIGMARQLSLLLMEIYREEGVTFAEYHECEDDLAFYAQVADGRKYALPRQDDEVYERLRGAMGDMSRHRMSQYRRLLRLDYDMWLEADEQGWTENYIRILLTPEKDDSELTPVNTPTQEGSQEVDKSPLNPPDAQGEALVLKVGAYVIVDGETPGIVQEKLKTQRNGWIHVERFDGASNQYPIDRVIIVDEATYQKRKAEILETLLKREKQLTKKSAPPPRPVTEPGIPPETLAREYIEKAALRSYEDDTTEADQSLKVGDYVLHGKGRLPGRVEKLYKTGWADVRRANGRMGAVSIGDLTSVTKAAYDARVIELGLSEDADQVDRSDVGDTPADNPFAVGKYVSIPPGGGQPERPAQIVGTMPEGGLSVKFADGQIMKIHRDMVESISYADYQYMVSMMGSSPASTSKKRVMFTAGDRIVTNRGEEGTVQGYGDDGYVIVKLDTAGSPSRKDPKILRLVEEDIPDDTFAFEEGLSGGLAVEFAVRTADAFLHDALDAMTWLRGATEGDLDSLTDDDRALLVTSLLAIEGIITDDFAHVLSRLGHE